MPNVMRFGSWLDRQRRDGRGTRTWTAEQKDFDFDFAHKCISRTFRSDTDTAAPQCSIMHARVRSDTVPLFLLFRGLSSVPALPIVLVKALKNHN